MRGALTGLHARVRARQGDQELATAARGRAGFDGAAVRLDHLPAQRQAEARAGGLRGVERAPDPAEALGVHAGAVVAHAQPHLAARQVLAGLEHEPRGRRLGLGEASRALPIRLISTRRSFSASPRTGRGPAIVALDRDAERGAPLGQRGEGGIHHFAHLHLRERHVFLAGEAQQVGDAALDALELCQCDPRVLHVLARGRVLSHLLHQALGSRDGVADLVRDARRELLDVARVCVHQAAALARDVGVHALVHLLLDDALAQARGGDRAEPVTREADAPGERDDRGSARARDEAQEGDDGQVGDEVREEADLAVGFRARLAQRALFGRQGGRLRGAVRLRVLRVFPAEAGASLGPARLPLLSPLASPLVASIPIHVAVLAPSGSVDSAPHGWVLEQAPCRSRGARKRSSLARRHPRCSVQATGCSGLAAPQAGGSAPQRGRGPSGATGWFKGPAGAVDLGVMWLDALTLVVIAWLAWAGARAGPGVAALRLLGLPLAYAGALAAGYAFGPALAREFGLAPLVGALCASTAGLLGVQLSMHLLTRALRDRADAQRRRPRRRSARRSVRCGAACWCCRSSGWAAWPKARARVGSDRSCRISPRRAFRSSRRSCSARARAP